MHDVSAFQDALDRLGTTLGEETLALYAENFGFDWPDEESTTGALLGAVAAFAQRHADEMQKSGYDGALLKAKLTRKTDEKRHGADALIRFSCAEPYWQIKTGTLIQAKRHDRDHPFSTADHLRLTSQLDKMMHFTPESFAMLYSHSEGIQLVPALAARAFGGRDLFDLPMLGWPQFLSDVLRGRIGEPISERLPYPGEGWSPTWILEIEAQIVRERPVGAAMAAR